MPAQNNEPNDIKIRKFRDTLVTGGFAIIAFGIWTVIKSIMEAFTILRPMLGNMSFEDLTQVQAEQLRELIDSNAQLRCGNLDAQLYKLADDGDLNERCLMVDLAVGDRKLLVTADSPKEQERKLTEQAALEDTDILIVGHHGSKDASSEELLGEVGGGVAVISVGYNNYGQPAPETLAALEKHGYQVRRTDEDGTVEIVWEREHG
jgi:beta-lactamase superfamily II metal-dependent hydrolase